MKLVKGLGLLSVLLVIFGSCFEPPEFPMVPEIEFEKLEFKGRPFPEDDSLIVYLKFKDGDGDLGLSKSIEHNMFPYQSTYYYQENNGTIEQLITEPVLVGGKEGYDFLNIPNPEKGKLVFFRTSKKPGYGFLPQQYHCSAYDLLAGAVDPAKPEDGTRLLIEKRALVALDSFVHVVDSFPRNAPEYYQIRDTIYFTPNPNHYNIEVDFLVKDPSAPGGFKEYDWRQEFCTTFDGRFPVFSDKGSSVDGTLRYGINSIGLEEIFSFKTLKLRISIKDRALNTSNVIETPEFTLLD